jgi:hypothetical protein
LQKAVGVILCLTLLMACQKSKVELLQRRLDDFRNILPQEVRTQFDARNYPAVVAGIDSLSRHVPTFKDKYERLKHEELIDTFSPQEVVDFFRQYFVDEIGRLKHEKGSW